MSARTIPYGFIVVIVAILVATMMFPALLAAPAGAASTDEAGSDAVDTGFVDVDPSSVHAAAIVRLVADGAMKGTAPERFAPVDPMTRAQLASVISALSDLPSATESSRFTDIDGSVHAPAIRALAQAGIVQGKSATTFEPESSVTRAQLAAMVVRMDARSSGDAAQLSGEVDGRGITPKARTELAGHDLEHEVITAYQRGYLQGTSSGRLEPNRSVTRDQAATVLDRFHRRDEVPAPTPGRGTTETAPRPEPEPEAEQPPASAAEATVPSSSVGHGSELSVGDVGPVAGVALASSGAITTSSNGQVIENLHVTAPGNISAAIVIRHNDVTVRNVRITAPGSTSGVRIEDGTSGTLIEHVEIDGRKAEYGTGRDDANHGNVGIKAFATFTARRNHIYDVRQGVQLWRTATASTVIENLVGEVWRNAPGVSTSGISYRGSSATTSQGTIARNRIEASAMSSIGISARDAAVVNLLVQDNLIVGTSTSQGQTAYGLRGGYQGDHRDGNRDIRIEGNRFAGSFQYGTNGAVNADQPNNTFTNNRLTGSSTNIAAKLTL